MHRKIAEIIKKIVDESPYTHFTCDVVPNTKSDGFWKVYLKFDSRGDAHSSSLKDILHPLGMVYGESLAIEDDGHIIEVS